MSDFSESRHAVYDPAIDRYEIRERTSSGETSPKRRSMAKEFETRWKDEVSREAGLVMLRFADSWTEAVLRGIAVGANDYADAMWKERRKRWVERG